MAGITVIIDHFLNLREKPKVYHSEKFYPVYIQLKTKENLKQIRSRINEHLKIYRSNLDNITQGDKRLEKLILSGYFSQFFFDDLIAHKKFPVYHLLNDEKKVLDAILSDRNPTNKNFLQEMERIEKDYKSYTRGISDIIDDKVKKQYIGELHDVFLQLSDHEKDKNLFNIVNYFIHFVNWNNSFYNFYNNTFEIIPGGLKEVENKLSAGLLISIKAYLALHSRINLIKRFLEKREQGRISSLSYLDWQSGVKDMVSKHYIQLFGRQTGLEYIDALDKILAEEVV